MLKPRYYLGPVLLAGLLFFSAGPLQAAAERILHFQSDIVVHPDSSMTVTETIQVRSAQREIRRGIIREFPTTYRDRFGNRLTVGFAVEEVLRDGRTESYHIKPVANGVKIYIGRKEVFLPAGVHTYTIRYRTDRQLGYFQDFDELYWNVTGNGWTFAIDQAEARIELPPGAMVLQHAGYTGPQGAKGRDFTAWVSGREIGFKTTRPLGPREGLTVAVAWPKGLVTPPSQVDRARFFLRDNLGGTLALGALLLLSAFYLFAWVRVGRDPEKGTIIPLFTSPRGFSPAATRFIMRMGFDHKAFAAAVVDMAVKGHLQIQEEDGTYTLVQQRDNPAGLSRSEQKLSGKLFADGKSVVLENRNYKKIQGAISALKTYLKLKLEKVYFLTNSGYLVPGLAITLLAFGAVALTDPEVGTALFCILWLSLWTVACYFLAVRAYRAWQGTRGGFRLGTFLGAVFISFIAVPFFFGEVMVLGVFAASISLVSALVLAAIVFLDALFYHLLKAPTLRGRRVMDQIEGFKLYLSVAEKERLNLLNPPDKTPALFEKYLPYAMALDVENEWNEQFAQVLARAGEGGRPYQPRWYSGDSYSSFDSGSFASSLGNSLSSAISSSSTAPGSSSGSGGGGFSGGGGGGGGGSGW
jgi:uncharacterized membrane protein YgcG